MDLDEIKTNKQAGSAEYYDKIRKAHSGGSDDEDEKVGHANTNSKMSRQEPSRQDIEKAQRKINKEAIAKLNKEYTEEMRKDDVKEDEEFNKKYPKGKGYSHDTPDSKTGILIPHPSFSLLNTM